jgi:hypothetical protein
MFMPIVKDGDSVCIEYAIPQDIKNLITDDFLKEFRNQLFRIHDYYSLETFAEDGIPMNTSTSGWFAALGKACLLTNKEALLDYWRTLPWYDSDVFDGELADMLIERGFILGDLSKVIEQQLGIKYDDLRVCNDCGKMYTEDMVVEITDVNEDELFSNYRCLHCQDVKETKDGNGNASDYYRSILKELDEYKNNHPINNEYE